MWKTVYYRADPEQVADGMYSAIIRATKPASADDKTTASIAGAAPAQARHSQAAPRHSSSAVG
ncbi:hypothetical protein [Acrocarpospora sp. B8E8]|uniref:hypothetical protein n=1 Tax=Acrocarpospora sp. B8E8 TaxID=3153572 RepID=UPI00325CBF1E